MIVSSTVAKLMIVMVLVSVAIPAASFMTNIAQKEASVIRSPHGLAVFLETVCDNIIKPNDPGSGGGGTGVFT